MIRRVFFRLRVGPWVRNRWRFLGFQTFISTPQMAEQIDLFCSSKREDFQMLHKPGLAWVTSSACPREGMILICRLFSKVFHMIFMIWLSWFSLQNMMKCIEVPKTSSIISIRLRRWRPWNPSLVWVFWRCLSGEVPAWSISPTKQVVSVVHIDILQFGAYTKHVWLTWKKIASSGNNFRWKAYTIMEILELFAITIPSTQTHHCVFQTPKKRVSWVSHNAVSKVNSVLNSVGWKHDGMFSCNCLMVHFMWRMCCQHAWNPFGKWWISMGNSTCISITWQIHFQVGECLWFPSDPYWFSVNILLPLQRWDSKALCKGQWMLKFAYDNSQIICCMIFFKKLLQPQEYAQKAMVKTMTRISEKKWCLQFQLPKTSHISFFRTWPWVNLQHCLGPFSRKPWPSWISSVGKDGKGWNNAWCCCEMRNPRDGKALFSTYVFFVNAIPWKFLGQSKWQGSMK